ncbi:MAG: DUF4391 domain-containing protein, partial [Bacteroidales bacterium]|nr:DUF4391 domain-containing protein [Bacteroidales bacterium]
MLGFSGRTEQSETFKMNMLLREMKASKDVRSEAKGVESVVLTNVVNNDAMNFHGVSEIKEIYVIRIALLSKDVPMKFIGAFDRIIHFHTVFVLTAGEEYALVAAPKSCAGESVKTGKYYMTPWTNSEPKVNLPLGTENMTEIYFAIFEKILGLSKRSAESLKDYITRYDSVQSLKTDIEKQQKRVDKE